LTPKNKNVTPNTTKFMVAILLLKEIVPTMTPCFVDRFWNIRRTFKTFGTNVMQPDSTSFNFWGQ